MFSVIVRFIWAGLEDHSNSSVGQKGKLLSTQNRSLGLFLSEPNCKPKVGNGPKDSASLVKV